MHLLAKKEAQSKIRKENNDLVERNVRLRKMEREIISRLNTAKLDYSPEKVKALEEYEKFSKDLEQRKSKRLEELNAYEKLIEERKEIYYGLIAKQDELEEQIYQAGEREKKLDLRERFISDIEEKAKQWMKS